MDNIIDAKSKNKCAHEECNCEVGFGQQYCSDYCSDADEIDEVETPMRLRPCSVRAERGGSQR
jgi:hypothetical protein